jgi:hypothetical protein
MTLLRSWNLKGFANYRRLYLSKDYLIRFLPSAIVVLLVFITVAYTISSPKAFNFHDDLEKYLSHPIRMLATGSLRGSPFNALSTETFGGQAFLHGFAVAHWPIGYVNTVDAVFAFILCLMMILSIALRTRLPFWFIPLVVTVPIFINPQYVNVSAIYTAVALMLLLFLGLWVHLGEHNSHGLTTWRFAATLGLIYSAIIALKTVYLLFVVIHFTLLLIGSIFTSYSWKQVLSWVTKVIGSIIIFISPWMLLYYSNWINLLSNINTPYAHLIDSGYYRFTEKGINLLSVEPLFYGFGASFAHYTLTMVFVAFCSIFLFVYKFPNQLEYKGQTAIQFAACATPTILYLVSIVIIAPILLGPNHGLRYLCPLIIAAVPSTLVIALTRVSESIQKNSGKSLLQKASIFILVCFSIGLLGCFFQSLSERTRQAFKYGYALSFDKTATKPQYIAYNRFALSSDAKKEVQEAQQIVPEGELLIAWTPLALHLDYRRNPIIDVDPAGLANPWIDFPFGKESTGGTKSFANLGAYYILWQYRSFAVRSEQQLLDWAASPYPRSHTIGVRTHQFVKMLREITRDSQILYDSGSILIMKLPDKTF